MRRLIAVTICVLALPASANAAGGPVPAFQGGFGVTAPGWNHTYHALRAGHDSLVVRLIRRTGEVRETRLLHGRWGVAGVGYDGTTTGLSADGRTLVLAEVTTRFPIRRTRLLRLATSRLQVRDRITLPGWWSVDAISPDGRWLYLLHYTRPARDVTDYEVRAYDLRAHRLVTAPVVDKREPDEQMGGIPVTRALSPDGRWAYTLYDNPDEPFIHALDTARREAACIDLPQLTGTDLAAVRLGLAGGTLRITREGAPLALVDRRTFAVREPPPATWFGHVLAA
jgi:hypothetical protein